jgi:uncharacterized membrane protein
MHTLLLTLHVVAAVFLIGPLVAAANQASRALSAADVGTLRSVSRTVTTYGWASLAVGVLGAPLAQRRYGQTFGEAWLLVSLILFVLASAIVIGLLAPLLRRAVGTAQSGSATAALAGRAAALGGIASLLYVAVTVLMAWQPGG